MAKKIGLVSNTGLWPGHLGAARPDQINHALGGHRLANSFRSSLLVSSLFGLGWGSAADYRTAPHITNPPNPPLISVDPFNKKIRNCERFVITTI